MMRGFVGSALVAAGIIIALFVGGYLMLYGGIVQVIEAAKADPVDSGSLAWGTVRIVFFEAGVLAGAPLAILGFFLIWRD